MEGKQGDMRASGQRAESGEIVEKVVDGVIYTVEGNAGDAVKQNQYEVGAYVILGFGVVEE